MLDLDAVRTARVRHEPFTWVYAKRLFAPVDAERLRNTFPTDGFTLTRGLGTAGKAYQMDSRTLHEDGAAHPLEDLHQGWRRLLDQLLGDDYRESVSDLTRVDVKGCAAEIRLCRYGPSCWLDPHTDRPDKKVTQVVYFNEHWKREWGGSLRILRSPDADDVAYEVEPGLGSSVVFVRSDRSWHAVAPVVPGVDRPRLSLLVHLTEG